MIKEKLKNTCRIIMLTLMAFLLCIVAMCNPISQDMGGKEKLSGGYPTIGPDSDHYIYIDRSSMSSLTFAMHMVMHSKPSVLFLARNHATSLPSYVMYENIVSNLPVVDRAVSHLRRFTIDNPNATITIFVADYDISLALQIRSALNAFVGSVQIIMLDNGTSSYTILTDPNRLSVLYYQFKNDLSTNSKSLNDLVSQMFTDLVLVVPALDSGIEYWLNRLETLTPHFTPEMLSYTRGSDIRYKPYKPIDIYRSLTEVQKQEFRKILKLNNVVQGMTIDQRFKDSTKKKVLILGAVHRITSLMQNTRNRQQGEIRDSERFMIDYVKNIYGDTHEYYYKPHPRTYNDFIGPVGQGVIHLPKDMVVESILWSYADNISAVVAFPTSVLMNLPPQVQGFVLNTDHIREMLYPTVIRQLAQDNSSNVREIVQP